jgi:type II secretory pathway pseudopilin PulG
MFLRSNFPAVNNVQLAKPRQSGSIYLMMLFVVAFLGVAIAAAATVWSTQRQFQREHELLFIGNEFRQAIRNYYLESPGMVKTYPAKLEDLVKDERFLFVKRHLRQIYVDPMTGTRNWKLIMAPQGGIMGVASMSDKAPIKTGMFEEGLESLNGRLKYSEWKFEYQPTSDEAGPSELTNGMLK